MIPRRLVVLPALGLLAGPLLLGSSSATTTATIATTTATTTATRSAAPTFRQYHAPAAKPDVRGNLTGGDDAGEPSLGFYPKTGDVLFMANKNTYRVTGFGAKNDSAKWTDVT